MVKQLRQAFLREAIKGKLVEQNSKDEPASELLKKIKAEKEKLIKEKKLKKEKELSPIKEDEIPFEIPENWVWCKLGELLSEIKYGTSQRCDYDSTKNSPVLRIPNVSSGRVNAEDLKFTNLSEKEQLELALEENDILIIRSNGSRELVGKTVLVENEFVGFVYAGYLVRLRFNKRLINAKYLWSATLSPFFREQIETPLRTTVGINNINSTEISNLLIPLPSFPEQHRIVAKLDQLMRLCDELEQSIRQSKEQTDMLLQAALREALQPKAKVVKLPALQEVEEKAYFKRAVLAAYIINQSQDDPNFGDTKFEKLLYLIEYHAIKRNFAQNYLQQVAGPFDNKFSYWFWNHIEKQKWFELS